MIEKYLVKKITEPVDWKVTVPGSKSMTNRALLMAVLSAGTVRVEGVLFSDDSRHFLACLVALGFTVEIEEEKKCVTVTGCGGRIPRGEAVIDVGSAGTAARFLAAMLGFSDGCYEIRCSAQMKRRPMAELFDLPADVEQSMNRINSAQREKEAAQSLAEAERIKVVTEARARAEAMEQAGRGIAAQRKAIADGISESLAVIKSSGVSAAEANQLFIFTQWTDMMSEFARNGRQSTVVLPSDFTATASMFEQMLVAQETEGADEFVIVEEEEK